jgi:NTE family protein
MNLAILKGKAGSNKKESSMSHYFKGFNYFIRAILLLFLVSCNTRYELPDEPCPLPECLPPNQVRLALVLGGGGARGLSHIGVLEEFENAGIPIDAIVGCSAGSIVGALYADCMDLGTLKKVLEPLRKWDILDINICKCRYGIVQGQYLNRYLQRNLHSRHFEELHIPFYAVSTDLLAGEVVMIGSGPLIPAIRASAAVPLIFCPVLLYDRMLVDGGVADPVPVKSAKSLGAQIVVAVDLSELLPKTCPTNLFGIASRSAELKLLLQSESCVREADVIIRPELGSLSMFDTDHNGFAYEAGKQAAREAIPRIKELLIEKGLMDKECQY